MDFRAKARQIRIEMLVNRVPAVRDTVIFWSVSAHFSLAYFCVWCVLAHFCAFGRVLTWFGVFLRVLHTVAYFC